MLSWRIINADVKEGLKELADESVQCVVTSPPYWGLRDYGVEGQLGLEATPELYVEHMVEVFREVRRVLRKDGMLWLNMGDCYARSPKRGIKFEAGKATYLANRQADEGNRGPAIPMGLKEKDLVGMPWRLAFALQADGWWLRSDIIWSKPNPMPESVRDRPTRSHEFVFLLTKNARYYYDADAIREPKQESTFKRLTQESFDKQTGGPKDSGEGNRSHRKTLRNQKEKLVRQTKWGERHVGYEDWKTQDLGRNKRSVWTIATQPYPEAHFATFPEKLVEPCIKAGTSEYGCCPECSMPWKRVIEKTGHVNKREPAHQPNNSPTKTDSTGWAPTTQMTNRWRSMCNCSASNPVPCIVLDPFCGSGTVGVVALELNCSFIGIELNKDYCKMARKRVGEAAPLFAQEVS